MKAGILCKATALLSVACWLHGGAAKEPPKPPPDVLLQVIVVGASGRGTSPVFDKRIPDKFRKQLQRCHLAYARYDLVGIQRKPASFGREVRFALPGKEALGTTVSPHDAQSHPLRVATRVLDSKSKTIQKVQMRVPYARTFLLHRPTGSAAVIMGVSGHKPPSPAAPRPPG